MLSRTVCFIAVLVGWVAFALLVTTIEATDATESTNENSLSACKQTDYRSYIQCLKRLKRHHNFPHFDSDCPEECYKKCSTDLNCENKCSHCVKITKRKHTYEVETECVSPECKTKDNTVLPGATNISTRIDIHNNFNPNVTSPCNPPNECPPQKPPPIPPKPTTAPPKETPCCPTCQPPTLCPIPMLPPMPPIILPPMPPPMPPIILPPPMPPIILPPIQPQPMCMTSYCPPYSHGGWNNNWSSGGGWGGCPYVSIWLCITSYGGYNGVSQQPDCSGCGFAYQYHRCDASCYMMHGTSCSGSNC